MEVKGTRSSSANYSNTSSSSTFQTCADEDMDLRRGPWTVEEDFKLINYIANHGEGRWNSLARCAGLKRTGKSCRLRWLNYLRPDVRRGNITLEEQFLILELHSRWGNRWSKIAQHLPGRTDNEIKNYWRTRVQKHAKLLKCDVNSKQFKDTMRYLWMPRLMERIQAANNATITTATAATATTTWSNSNGLATASVAAAATTGHMMMPRMVPNNSNNEFGGAHVTATYTPDNSSTAASLDSFGAPVLDFTDYYTIPVSNNPNPAYFQGGNNHVYSECLISPSGYLNLGIEFQEMEPNNNQFLDGGVDASDNLWNVEDIWCSQ